jgi:hypothetical protein
MKAHSLHLRQLFATIVFLVCPLAVVSAHPPLPSQQANAAGPDDPSLSNEEIKKFLLTAKIVNFKASKKGKTATTRLTLSDGVRNHDASFQPIDEHKPVMKFANGQTEMNFVDSYKYNIAAYELAEMLGLEDIVPVYVERNWHGNTGSLSWWLPVQMDEADRLKQKIPVPESAADTWDKQMYKIRVFDALVYDNDPNLTNVLIGQDWKPWRVDFSRAFRLFKDLRDPKDLVRCDRALLEKLKALDAERVTEKTKPYLNKSEVKALMARRDKIVETFQKLIAQKGENEVLY